MRVLGDVGAQAWEPCSPFRGWLVGVGRGMVAQEIVRCGGNPRHLTVACSAARQWGILLAHHPSAKCPACSCGYVLLGRVIISAEQLGLFSKAVIELAQGEEGLQVLTRGVAPPLRVTRADSLQELTVSPAVSA